MEESDVGRRFASSAMREDTAGGMEKGKVLGDESHGRRTVGGGWKGYAADRRFAALRLGIFTGSTACENTETDGVKNQREKV